MDRIHSVIRRPLFTEKSTTLVERDNTYVFAVEPRATKRDIADAVEKLFGVTVASVETT